MKKKRIGRLRTASEIERDRAIQEKYKTRPSLEEVVKSEGRQPIKQGDYLALMELAARLKERRQKLKISQSKLAELTGIDKAAISRLENGLIDNPTVGTLMRVAGCLNGRLRFELEDDVTSNSRSRK